VNHIIGIGHSVLDPQAVRRAIGYADLNRNARPGRPVTESFDLLVFDKDGIRAKPVETANRSVDQLRVPNFAESGLRVGQQGHFLPPLSLTLEHFDEGIFCSDIILKRIRRKRPGMPFVPESVHKRVHILHVTMAVV